MLKELEDLNVSVHERKHIEQVNGKKSLTCLFHTTFCGINAFSVRSYFLLACLFLCKFDIAACIELAAHKIGNEIVSMGLLKC